MPDWGLLELIPELGRDAQALRVIGLLSGRISMMSVEL